MINIKKEFKRNGCFKKQKNNLLLVSFSGEKSKVVKKKPKINTCLAIDVSGSMQDQLSGNGFGRFNNRGILNQVFGNKDNGQVEISNTYNVINKTKIELAKEAAIFAVNELNSGDIVSIVTFHSVADVLVPSIVINENNKKEIIEKIKGIRILGGTNLHSGWVLAATEVAKKMDNDYINRVILLSDGQTLEGVVNPVEICKDVSALYEKTISTSTFGIGNGFNEDLLEKMSTSGGGNFYFIEKEENFKTMFKDEFNGLSNICGTQLKIKFNLKDDVKVNNKNNFEIKDGFYLLPNVSINKVVSGLFEFEYDIEKIKEKVFNLGDLEIEYKDINGTLEKIRNELQLNVMKEKEWLDLVESEEIKVQETLLIIANNQLKAKKEIDLGNIQGARNILRAASDTLSVCGLQDSRISSYANDISATMLVQDENLMRKSITASSYNVRNSKK